MSNLILSDEAFPVSVDYAVSCQQMIASGNFHRVHQKIIDGCFRVEGAGFSEINVRIALLPGGAALRTQQVLGMLQATGFRPVRFEELLALAALLQGGVLRRNAHALGSSWNDASGDVHVPTCSLKSGRRLRLSQIRSEPAWQAVWDCFPCVGLV